MLWIDLKNLNDENVNDVLNYLDKFKKVPEPICYRIRNKNIGLITKRFQNQLLDYKLYTSIFKC